MVVESGASRAAYSGPSWPALVDTVPNLGRCGPDWTDSDRRRPRFGQSRPGIGQARANTDLDSRIRTALVQERLFGTGVPLPRLGSGR